MSKHAVTLVMLATALSGMGAVANIPTPNESRIHPQAFANASVERNVTITNTIFGGCTDPLACNFDPEASSNDGSCDYCACVQDSYSLTIEEYAADIVPGYTTYRIYVDLINSDDALHSVYGNSEEPMSLQFSEGFYNNAYASGPTASGVNTVLFDFFPELAGDSWVTIGLEPGPGDQDMTSTVESSDQPWTSAFVSGSANDGGDFTMDDQVGGAWYVLANSPNGLPDELGRTLIMQISTTAEFWGTVNLQIYEHGLSDSEIRKTISFEETGTFYPDGLEPSANCGCTNAAACNFDPSAQYDDGGCFYSSSENACDCEGTLPEEGYDCSGSCVADSDGDGICDFFEGCTSEEAVNYDPDAIDDDGSCVNNTYALSLVGVMDFTVPSGSIDGKAIHLQSTAGILDLSIFGLGVANNGEGSDGQEYTLPSLSVEAGDDILLLRSQEALDLYLQNCFDEFEVVIVTGNWMNHNGDDAIELFEWNAVIETFGDVNVDGTGLSWEYTDSWAYKANNVWEYGGVNCTDGSLNTQNSTCLYPHCSSDIEITFNVNMANETVAESGVYIVLPEISVPGDYPMEDEDGNGIYSITLGFTPPFTGNYTFLNGNCGDYSCKENLAGQDCADGTWNDRVLYNITEDTIVNTCFGECSEDGSCTPQAPEVTVVFQVDMSEYEGAYEMVNLNGTFNGWCGQCTEMTDADADGVYTANVELHQGVSYEYKFTLDGWTAHEEFEGGEECTSTIDGFTNRTFTVDSSVETLDPVCWGSCTACEGVNETACEIFFSEYAEGSSNNKYLEIYNPTASTVFLGQYLIGNCGNGCQNNGPTAPEYFLNFPASASIAAGGFYIIAHPSADSLILAQADLTHGFLSNGDDAYGLFNSDTLMMDAVGEFGVDPGSGWDVAGVTNGTKDHTLVRTEFVYAGNDGDWAMSAGTNEFDSEWIVLDQNDWSDLGMHTFSGSCSASTAGCTDEFAVNYDVNATSDDGSCIYISSYTIQEIQSGGLSGQMLTYGIVTAVYPPTASFSDNASSYVIQDGTGANSAIWVIGNGVAQGDEVSVIGNVLEVYGLRQIQMATPEVLSSGNMLPEAEELNPSAINDEQWECVLISMRGDCVNADAGYGEWHLDSGSGIGVVDDIGYNAIDEMLTNDGTTFVPLLEEERSYRVVGANTFLYGNWKLLPRNSLDVVRLGCTHEAADNFDAYAQEDDGSCLFDCLTDTDDDGICDEFEVGGCTANNACNYDSLATDDDGSCSYAASGYDCLGNCVLGVTLDLVFDYYPSELSWEITNAGSNLVATGGPYSHSDVSAQEVVCLTDGIYTLTIIDSSNDGMCCAYGDGSYTLTDSGGNVLATGGEFNAAESTEFCIGDCNAGCTDITACNYNAAASEDDGSCAFESVAVTINPNPFSNSENYWELYDAQSTVVANGTYISTDICLQDDCYTFTMFDLWGDGMCCEYGPGGYTLTDNTGQILAEGGEFGSSESTSFCLPSNLGCMDVDACNFDNQANTDDGTCFFPTSYVDCGGICLTDTDDDGICDELEVTGCTESMACNFFEGATDDDGSCDYSCQCQDEAACNYGEPVGVGTLGILIECWEFNVELFGVPLWYVNGEDSTGQGIDNWTGHAPDMFFNEGFELDACWTIQSLGIPDFFDGELWITLLDTENGTTYFQDTLLLNSNNSFNIEICASDYVNDGCTYPLESLDCSGTCINDTDGDFICDELEITGCQDWNACNYNQDATDEDGSCLFPAQGFDCSGNCLSGDNDGDGICNDSEAASCGMLGACNFDPFYVINDPETCNFPGLWKDCDGNCILDIDGDGECDAVSDFICGNGRLIEAYEGSASSLWCNGTDEDVDYRVLGSAGIWNIDLDSESIALEWAQSEFEEDLKGIVAGSSEWGGKSFLMGIDRAGHPVPLLFCPETGNTSDEMDEYGAEFVPTPVDAIITDLIAAGEAFVAIQENQQLIGWGFTEEEFALNYPPAVQNAQSLFYREYGYSALAVLEGNDVVAWGGAFQFPFIDLPNYIAQEELQIVDLIATDQNGFALMEDGTMRSWGSYNAGMTLIPEGLDSVIALDFHPHESFLTLLQANGSVQTMGFDMFRIPEGLLTNIIDVQAIQETGSVNPKIIALRADGHVLSLTMEHQDGSWIVSDAKDTYIPDFEPILCIPGCTDESANNFIPSATDDDNSCTYGCEDTDGDGICNVDEVVGCTIASACNFNPVATQNNGTCYFADEFEDCAGNCFWESIATGNCGELAGLLCDAHTFAISPGSGGCSTAKTAYAINDGVLQTAYWASEYNVSNLPDLHAIFSEPNDGQIAWIDLDGFTGGLGSCNELVVPTLSNALKVDLEQNHGVIVRANGTVASFAPSSAYDALEQTPIIFNYFVLDACAGADFNLAVDGSQNILYWGIPNFALQNDYAEVPHAGGFVQVDAYAHVAAAVTNLGELVVWGDDTDGLVSSAPNSVSDAVAVRMGNGFGVVLHENGDVTQWGSNPSMPLPPWGLGNIIDISVSADQVLAMAADGTFVSWGAMALPGESDEYNALGTVAVDVELCIPGCTSPDFHNFDSTATLDDGSCNNIGCTVAEALNYEPWATDDDGSCIILGCTDSDACNYNPDAQYGIRLDVVAVHEGVVGTTDLSGFTTYHVVLTGPNSEDRLSAVMGDEGTPLNWQVNDGIIWHENLAGNITPDINTTFIGFIPELAFDSWVTIGVDPYSYNSSEQISTVESINQPWIEGFEAGGGITMNDNYGGAWFVAGAQTTGVFGDDHEVLLAQLTTNGSLSIESMNIQILPVALVSDDVQLFYETNVHACSYPNGVLDCAGECENDTDDDGVCDENELPGCMNSLACNFNVDATDEDGSCILYEDEIDLVVETVATHDGPGPLTGTTTYRLYAEMHNADERVSAVIGFEDHPLLIEQGTGLMYQHPLGGPTPAPLGPAALTLYPEAAYDSYVAIGRGHEDLPTSVQILSGEEQWDNFFEVGLPIDISSVVGGGWFSTDTNDGLPSGEDNRVLIGQFTTTDGVQGQVSVQYFNCNGEEHVAYDLLFVSENNSAGCMDMSACNYDTEATIDDGTCCFSSCATISGYSFVELTDLIGNEPVAFSSSSEVQGLTSFNYCLSTSCYQVSGTTPTTVSAYWNGADVSFNVVEFGVLGSPEQPCVSCTDDGACNYESSAIFDDESCDYLPGDFNGDLVSTVADMLLLLSEFNNCEFPEECVSDIDGSGFVSVDDLLFFLSYFGSACDD